MGNVAGLARTARELRTDGGKPQNQEERTAAANTEVKLEGWNAVFNPLAHFSRKIMQNSRPLRHF
jgi:hypothetical protein